MSGHAVSEPRPNVGARCSADLHRIIDSWSPLLPELDRERLWDALLVAWVDGRHDGLRDAGELHDAFVKAIAPPPAVSAVTQHGRPG